MRGISGYNIQRQVMGNIVSILKNHEKIFQARSHIIKFKFEKASRMKERLERAIENQLAEYRNTPDKSR